MTQSRVLFALLFAISVCKATTVTIFFTALPPVYENKTYNGLSTATINGIPNQLLLCDDYTDRTQMPSSSNLIFDYSNLVGPTPLQYAQYVSVPGPTQADLNKYKEAAVLLWELTQLGVSANPSLVTDYQYAVWNLFTPSVSLFRTNQSALQSSALALVQQGGLDNVYKALAIYTPAAQSRGNQEFLQLTRVTPEPETVWMFVGMLGVFGIVAAVRRRRAA